MKYWSLIRRESEGTSGRIDLSSDNETLRAWEAMARIKSLHNLRFDTSRNSAFDRNSLNKLSDVIGDTIRIHEITSRIEGSCSHRLLNWFTAGKTLDESLIQSRNWRSGTTALAF